MGPPLLPLCSANRDLPVELRKFRDFHAGESLVVCGCGHSLSQFAAPERVVTIGVNDVGRLFDPDYLVVLNPPGQFARDRFEHVQRSRAKAVFTHLDLNIGHPHIVRFRLGQRAGVDLSHPDVLPYTRNSPYLALCLALHMGARRIGVIGVDFTEHHFFAPTGRHVLNGELSRIDEEYARLYERASLRGIEIFNLSAESRLTAFPKMSQEEFLRSRPLEASAPKSRVFFVNYPFLSCGTVFRDGLTNAARELGVDARMADWDAPRLREEIESFHPDLLFVVHGRKFCARFQPPYPAPESAVWLLDEPYEVDDTQRFSKSFSFVFVNDPNTLARHPGAHYLPVCYDPLVHTYLPGQERPHAVGFVGGCNPTREAALARLARRGLLSYVAGGPWSDPAVRAVCISPNIPAGETARLYRGTRVVVNLFRDRHHYNREGIPAVSLNPRVYEALACGALVISEHRPEIDAICPELPVFRNAEEMESQVDRFLRDPDLFARVRKDCIRRLAAHTYARRLATVLETALRPAESALSTPVAADSAPAPSAVSFETVPALPDWEVDSGCALVDIDGGVVLRKERRSDRRKRTRSGRKGEPPHRGVGIRAPTREGRGVRRQNPSAGSAQSTRQLVPLDVPRRARVPGAAQSCLRQFCGSCGRLDASRALLR